MGKYKICPGCGKHNTTRAMECKFCEMSLAGIKPTDDETESARAAESQKSQNDSFALINAYITDIQEEIIGEFSSFDDWMDKYQLIIDMGSSLPGLDEQFKTDDNLIEGCQSRVWLHAGMQDGKVLFQADSDAIITKGLIALLMRVWSGQTPEDILASDLHFIDAIGLSEHLSPTRSNGLLSMGKQMRCYALAFSAKP